MILKYMAKIALPKVVNTMSDLIKILDRYKEDKIAIYGLSVETERVLNEIGQQYQIVGLLDGYKEEGTLYGRPIISLENAIEYQVKLILVVARPGSCRAIAKRISATCMDNQIKLIDVRGKDLCNLKRATYCFKNTDGISRAYLMERIQESDVVSIDLFDTLVMRQTLFSTDIFELVDCRLREKGIVIKDFSKRRLASEKHLAKTTAPTLAEIYSYMKSAYAISEIIPEELAELEWKIDYDLVLPRQDMCHLMDEVHGNGKEIYIVSDTFYTKEQIKKLLEKCHVGFYTDIFASCEYKTAKGDALFEIVRDVVAGRKCIHIGDDVVADIESAEKHGFFACKIHSGMDLLELTGYLGLWDRMEGVANRIKIGMFVSRLFNSPFQFENEEQKLSIRSAYDLGYLLFAPMISDFVLWFREQVQKYNLQNIWFCARDGYLIKKMYDVLYGETASVYFLTSRTAAVRAGVETERDIKYVEEMKFGGTLRGQLWERFGIVTQTELGNRERGAQSLLDYSQDILNKAIVNKSNYRKYIGGLHRKPGDIAFFDFVAKGTSQMYLQRLVEGHLKGLYFLQLEKEYMREEGLDILSFYEQKEIDDSSIYENYYILETILTSSMPSIIEFDENGEPCYMQETRKKEDIMCVKAVQNGILDYFRIYMELCPEQEVRMDKKMDEIFLALIQNIVILDEGFNGLKVEDPFFNRTTDVADLI